MYLQIDKRDEQRTAIIEDTGNTYTFGDLKAFTGEFGGWIPSRKLIFIFCQNTMGAIAAHIACIENRIVPLMISSHMDAALRDHLIETYHPEYLWAPEWMAAEFGGCEPLARKYG